jgi:UPF0716 protein FxsA
VRRLLLASAASAALLVVVEVFVVILVARQIGVPWTVALILATSSLGAILLRREGPRSWRAFRGDLRAGKPPGISATEGLLALVGGILMLLPGFVTDVVGAVLVLPPTRRVTGRAAQSVLSRRLSPATASSLFGPRTVRVRTGRPQPPPAPPSYPPSSAGSGSRERPGEVVEGEIIDPSG